MEKKLTVSIGIIIALIMVSYPILAAVTAPPVVIERDGQGRPTVIIEQGKGREVGLVKVTHIDYAWSDGKARQPTTDSCYSLAGYRWRTKLPITYTINPYSGLPTETIRNAITAADAEWDREISRQLFSGAVEGNYPWRTFDGKNSISFADCSTPNVIAVAVTWYKVRTKEAVESDILFDTDFTWGNATVNPEVMDLQNIATHEIGHTLGLDDLDSSECSVVTMYAYSDYGETGKRTLEIPDVIGLKKIYGS